MSVDANERGGPHPLQAWWPHQALGRERKVRTDRLLNFLYVEPRIVPGISVLGSKHLEFSVNI